MPSPQPTAWKLLAVQAKGDPGSSCTTGPPPAPLLSTSTFTWYRWNMWSSETRTRLSVQWSFQVSRGSFAQTVLTESISADLLLVGLEQAAPASTVTSNRGPVMVIDDTSSTGHALDTGLRLARRHADTLVVLLAHESAEPPRRLADVPSPVYVQRCSAGVEALLRAVRRWQPQLLLLDRSSPLVSAATMNTLVPRLRCPLVLVQ